MSRVKRIGDLNSEIEQLLHIGPVARQIAVERLAFNQLHGDEILAVGLADFVDDADVRVIERRGGARFELEALQRLLMLRQVFGEELQRDAATELNVLSNPHRSHAAGAEALEHLIMGNLADRATSWSIGLYRCARKTVKRCRRSAEIIPAEPRLAHGRNTEAYFPGRRLSAKSDTREAAGGSRFASTATV